MVEIIVSIDEHKLLKKFQAKLEGHFGVQICLPEVIKYSNCSNDIIVVSISGESKNINYVKKFMAKKMKKLVRLRQQRCAVVGDVPVITLSESDSDNAVLAETQNMNNKKTRKRKRSLEKNETQYPLSGINVNLTSTTNLNENACQVFNSTFKPEFGAESSSSSSATDLDAIDIPKTAPNNPAQGMDDCIVILSENINPPTVEFTSLIDVPKDIPYPENCHKQVTDDSIIILSENINPLSENCSFLTSVISKESTSQSADDSIILLSENVPLPVAAEYISLRTASNVVKKKKNSKKMDGVMVLSDEVPIPYPQMRRILRPIVIDGSNVARLHGKIQNTFSCKGIKLSVEYFLKRGHTQVTALVPQYRSYCKYGPVPTTDQDLLEELAKSQNVVYTPSRRLHGRIVACYDDRFIVDLASKNGGVILSNDNYRDIMQESPEYKKTIEERLLMFLFVGDILMIPDDPLGRNGPNLDTFLSMKETEIESSSLPVSNEMITDQIQRNTNTTK